MNWSLALLLIVLGVYLSKLNFLNNEWLSRAGCLIVMLGIWSGLGGIMQEGILASRMRWRRRNLLMQTRLRLEQAGGEEADIEKELAGIEENFEKQFAELTHKLKLSVGFQEISLLLTGTFLWGFGDLFV